MIKKFIPVFGIIFITVIFFWQFFLKGLLPIPADTIIGLYHPYRDFYADEYPNGIPFKNFLITDPVRQQYPWRKLSIESIQDLNLPTWNPYAFSGTPNLANFQSAVFNPFNILFLLFPFELSWAVLIMLQPILAGVFLYFYLRNLKLDEYSSFFGSIIFAYSGFFTTWLEWGTVLFTALWLPLILLSIDKIIFYANNIQEFSIFPTSLRLGGASNFKISKYFLWFAILISSTACSFFAGHTQTFFYLSLLSIAYLFIRIRQSKNNKKLGVVFPISGILIIIILLVQLIPSLNFILLSGRELDQFLWQKEGWFIPWRHLVQFIIPDFFGNPTTLNYWGAWNYGELTGYAGISALVLALFALFFRKDKKTFYSGALLIVSLLLALPVFFSKVPFLLNIPIISTFQPTRLIFLIDFSISVLGALGLNYLIIRGKTKQVLIPIVFIGLIIGFLLIFTMFGNQFGVDVDNLNVAKRNIMFPGLMFVISLVLLILITLTNKKVRNILILVLILFVIIDLFRFSWKFNTFSKKEYLYPQTKSLKYLQENIENYRIATTDSRILAPNFSIMHKIATAEGYDPLYLKRYAEFVSAINRQKPDINPPFGFNRIIRIENYSSNLVDLLGIKYLLSLSEINISGFSKVFEEGQTKVYENNEVLPRAFFVNEIVLVRSKQEAIDSMYKKEFNPRLTAVVEGDLSKKLSMGSVKFIKYSDVEIIIETNNINEGFLVLTDSFYPTWHAKINNQDLKIYRTDYNFRGIFVPRGKQIVIFKNYLL